MVSTVVTPSSLSSSSSSQVSRRACGSIPAVGSSTKSSSGRPTSAIARHSRCCCPPDSRRYGVRPQSSRPSRSTSIGTGRGWACSAGDVAEHLLGPDAGPGAAGLQHHADPGQQGRGDRRPGRGPRTRTVPPWGRRKPSQVSSVVVLPAPLGPSTAVMLPRSTVRSRPSTAVLSPYLITSPPTSTAGGGEVGTRPQSRSVAGTVGEARRRSAGGVRPSGGPAEPAVTGEVR